MKGRKEITERKDIELLIRKFYEKVMVDSTIGFIFTDVAKIDLESHLPKLFDFWETQLLGEFSYQGNPMKVHMDLHLKEALKKEHFDQWLLMFNQTVDEHFEGEKAHLAKERALSIATVMQIRVATMQ